MFATKFDYYAPDSMAAALNLLREHGDRAKLLAGGHSLLPMMKLRLATPEILIDLRNVPGLREIRQQAGVIAIGAGCTYSQIAGSDIVRSALPMLVSTIDRLGDPQVRNRGTIGGSLAHSDPAADLPAVVLALGGELVARSGSGERTISADDFFQGMFTTALRPEEVLTEVRLPVLEPNVGAAYAKLENLASRYAIVGVAAVIGVANGMCSRARVAVTGAGSYATRARAAEDAIVGKPISEESMRAAAALAPQGVEPVGDLHASPEYRVEMVKVYAYRALAEAAAAASKTSPNGSHNGSSAAR